MDSHSLWILGVSDMPKRYDPPGCELWTWKTQRESELRRIYSLQQGIDACFHKCLRLWIEADVLSSSTGDVRKPNSEGSNLLLRKALPGSRLLEINTCETNATNCLAFDTFSDFVDWSRHHNPCCPVSGTKTMGLDGDWMF